MHKRPHYFFLLVSAVLPMQIEAAEGQWYSRATLEETTPQTIARDYGVERSGRPDPKLGLTLAGGGTRAGFFALGILSGLHSAGVLKHVDVISSVSGGGYAAFWYYMRMLEADRLGLHGQDPFSDCIPGFWLDEQRDGPEMNAAMKAALAAGIGCGDSRQFSAGDPFRWQAHLAEWPDIFQVKPIAITGNKQRSKLARAAAPVIAQSILGAIRHENESEIAARYQAGIGRVWGLEPLPRRQLDTPTGDGDAGWNYANATGQPGDSRFSIASTYATWPILTKYLQEHPEKPNWILNARIGTNSSEPDPRKIYEISGQSHGSDYTKYVNATFEKPDLLTSVRISGAFADAQGLQNGTLAHFAVKALSGLTKDVQWGEVVASGNAQTSTVIVRDPRASDGGGEENMGLYSLIRRGVPEIIVVDAGSDVEGNMADLCRVKHAIEAHGLTMRFELLEDLTQLCDSGGNVVYNTSAWLNRVVPGVVVWPRHADGTAMPDTHLWLVKLGWNQQLVRNAFNAKRCGSGAHDVPCIESFYYGSNAGSTVLKDGYMIFPNLDTARITAHASTYLLWAYRALGASVVSDLEWDSSSGSLHNRGSTNCPQKHYAVRKGLRPVNNATTNSLAECSN